MDNTTTPSPASRGLAVPAAWRMTATADMTGKTVLVTGSTDGIGRETARELARLGARVLVHGRSEERVSAALRYVAETAGHDEPQGFVADFSSLEQVRRLGVEVWEATPRLDVLINNAGVFSLTYELSQDGYELTLAVNHLAPFLLTNLLIDRLVASAPSRVVDVASGVHFSARLDFRELAVGDPQGRGERRYDPHEAYAQSKFCNVLFTYRLASRLRGAGVTANCLHPGVISTKLLRAGFQGGGQPPQEGARTPVYLASSPDVAEVTGRFFVNREPRRSSALSYDAETQRRLWEVSARLVGRDAD